MSPGRRELAERFGDACAALTEDELLALVRLAETLAERRPWQEVALCGDVLTALAIRVPV